MSPARRSLTGWALALGLLWLSVQVGLFYFGPRTALPSPHHGVRYANDTQRFLGATDAIMARDGSKRIEKKDWSYLGYELFIIFFIKSGLGMLGLVVVQALLTLLAAWCLWRLASRLYDTRTGLIAALLYVACIDIHIWNFYVLADSLFVSMGVVTLFMLLEAGGWWWKAACAMAVLFTASIKPQGLGLLVSTGAYAAYLLWKARRYLSFAGVSCLLLAVALGGAMFLSNYPSRIPLVERYVKGAVIVNYSPADKPMPEALKASVAAVKNPVVMTLVMVAKDPGHVSRFFGAKLWYFFLHIRPYYSSLHNSLILAALLPAYALALLGLVPRSRVPGAKLLLLSVFLFHVLIVLLTHVSRDGRYLLPLLPLVFVFTGAGAVRLWEALAASPRGRPRKGASRP